MSKELFAQAALANIPKLLTLQDRNPHSPTYGCFDRNFWHYKIIDFPSGMAQEFVWPLALAFALDIPGNPYFRQPRIRELVKAGILYAALSSRADGSCDDYFPFERAGGAAAFSLLACVESHTLLELNNSAALEFFERRADWLARHHESGRLTNHQALIVLCLESLSAVMKTKKWDEVKSSRLRRVLSWQSEEGWFQEYEGCDPGYHTLTVSCLARLYEMAPAPELKLALTKAIAVAANFIHPDGSYGGEYGSRNTYNFFPHGFELAGKWLPEALSINDRFLAGLRDGLAPCYADDHIIGHHTWNYLLAWRDFVEPRPEPAARPRGRIWLKEAGMIIDRRDDAELYLATGKGGVFKLFRDNRLAASDTHFSLRVRTGGSVRNAVGHLAGQYQVDVSDDEIVIRGLLGWAKQKQMTPLNLIILRAVMLSAGRLFPDLIRKLLQRMLITGKEAAPYSFVRSFKWEKGGWKVDDRLQAKRWSNVISAGIGCDQTSIYVVMSRTFQMGQLQPWLDLTEEIRRLAPDEELMVERCL